MKNALKRMSSISLRDIYGLRLYGESLLNEVVRNDLRRGDVSITSVAVMGIISWGLMFYFMSRGSAVIAFICAVVVVRTVAVAVEGGMFTFDTQDPKYRKTIPDEDPAWQWLRRSSPFIARVALIFVVAIMFERPLSTAATMGEITQAIREEENAARESVRSHAVDVFKKEYGEDMIITSQTDTVQGRIPRYQLQRFAERDRFLTHLREEERVKKEDAERRERIAVAEQYGDMIASDDPLDMTTGYDGGFGQQKSKTSFRLSQADKYHRQLSDHQKYMVEQLAAYDRTTRSKIDAFVKERDDKIEDIRAMSAGELVSKYSTGKTVTIDAGFYKLYETFVKLQGERPIIYWATWLFFLFVMLVEFYPLYVKLTLSPQTRNYFSVVAQALNGHDGALKDLEVRGIAIDREALLTLQRSWEEYEALMHERFELPKKQEALAYAMLDFLRARIELFLPDPNTGVSIAEGDLKYRIRVRFKEMVQPMIGELTACESVARLPEGSDSWPRTLPYPCDPRIQLRNNENLWWNILDGELRESASGYRYPQTTRTLVEELRMSAEDLYEKVWNDFTWEVDEERRKHFGLEERQEWYYLHLRKRVNELWKIQGSLANYGKEMPKWTFPGPRWDELSTHFGVVYASPVKMPPPPPPPPAEEITDESVVESAELGGLDAELEQLSQPIVLGEDLAKNMNGIHSVWLDEARRQMRAD